jgi:hypothetical protein
METVAQSRAAVVAYQDLLRLHLDERASHLIGTIEERKRNGRTYLYEKFRIGTEMVSRYLGEDKPELRARLDRAEALKSESENRQKQMTRLARVLRAEGFITTDRATGSLLLAFSRAGVFRLGGTLVGTSAYSLYQGELGVRMDYEELAQTGDMDFASFERLSVALYRSGVLIQVPRPERFAIHKLIVADRRKRGPDQLKARKDRAQAEFLIKVLAEDRPHELLEAYEAALSQGPRWRERIEASLKRMPETAERLADLVG